MSNRGVCVCVIEVCVCVCVIEVCVPSTDSCVCCECFSGVCCDTITVSWCSVSSQVKLSRP